MITRLYRAAYARAILLSEDLRRLTLRALCAWIAFISPRAMADGDIADIIKKLADGAQSTSSSALVISQTLGVFGVIGSLVMLKSMKNNPQIKPWWVAASFLVSLLLLGVPEIIKRGQTQMGMTPVSVG